MDFLETWTTDEIGCLYGQIAIVTGANSGIGFQTAKALATHGCQVIMACRTKSKAMKAAKKINKLEEVVGGSGFCYVLQLDVSDFDSIRSFVTEYERLEATIDGTLRLLVNNAGVCVPPHRVTEDGFEITLKTNYFGPFLLTHLLMDKLIQNSPSRVVTCGSDSEMVASVDWDDLTGKGYTGSSSQEYAKSKLMDHMFGYELNRRYSGFGVESFIVHPGYSSSEIFSSTKQDPQASTGARIWSKLSQFFVQRVERGALSTIFCATSREVEGMGGKYFGPTLNFGNTNEAVLANPNSTNKKDCKRLWKETEALLGIKTRKKASKRMSSTFAT